MPWSYWHRIEYVRVDRGQRVTVHAEDVDDHGFYLDKSGPDEYLRLCAEEFLTRWGAPPGSRWRAVLWRTDAAGRDRVRRLAEVELHWAGSPEPRPPGAGTPAAPVADLGRERP
ncbi:MAG TPA: hypothetical protein VIL00_07900 [Pseudonocardiaceae bacterium]